MKIEWIGHACFCITNQKGVKIITDPYEAGLGGFINYGPVSESADEVTVSHEHGDHNHVSSVLGNPTVIRGTGVTNAKGIEIKGITVYHDQEQGANAGTNTIFTFDVDGVHVTHLGDLGHSLSPEQLSKIENTDVLLAPTGGHPATLELADIDLWEQMRPRIVIPMHFKNEKCTFLKYGLDDLLHLRPAAKKIGTSVVSLSKEALPDPIQILILDPSR